METIVYTCNPSTWEMGVIKSKGSRLDYENVYHKVPAKKDALKGNVSVALKRVVARSLAVLTRQPYHQLALKNLDNCFLRKHKLS